MTFLIRTVVKYLRDTANQIEKGDCVLTDEQAMEIMSVIANEQLSKDQACTFLHIKRSRFDELIREGKIPKGRKTRGLTELLWNKKDLVAYNLSRK